jgi:hypothetical protein
LPAAARPVCLLCQRGILWNNRFPKPLYWQQQLDVLQANALATPHK